MRNDERKESEPFDCRAKVQEEIAIWRTYESEKWPWDTILYGSIEGKYLRLLRMSRLRISTFTGRFSLV